MFLVDWFFRFVVWTDPRHQNWLFPAEGWVVEHLGKEQARLLLKDKRRQDAADAEMQRLMYEKSAFGLQYVAPVIKGAVELLAPSGVEEKAGQAVADIRDLAGGLISIKYQRDHIEPKEYYRYRRLFYKRCLRRIASAGCTAASDLLSRPFTTSSTALEPTSAQFANALHAVVSQYDERFTPYTAEEQIDALSSLVVESFSLISWAIHTRIEHAFDRPSTWRQHPFDFGKPERPDLALKRRTNKVAIRSNQWACSEVYLGRSGCRELRCWRGCSKSSEGKERARRQPGLEQDFWIYLMEGLEERKRAIKERRREEEEKKWMDRRRTRPAWTDED